MRSRKSNTVVCGPIRPKFNLIQDSMHFLVVVVVLGFYVSSTAKVIKRRDLGLKSHPKDCISWLSASLNRTGSIATKKKWKKQILICPRTVNSIVSCQIC